MTANQEGCPYLLSKGKSYFCMASDWGRTRADKELSKKYVNESSIWTLAEDKTKKAVEQHFAFLDYATAQACRSNPKYVTCASYVKAKFLESITSTDGARTDLHSTEGKT